jgi:hypothetical protein
MTEHINSINEWKVFKTQITSFQNDPILLTYLQFSVIKWAKQHPGQNPIDVKSNEAIQI